MLRNVFYRSLYVLLWICLVLDALLMVVYPISILITVGVTILLFPFLLAFIFLQYCLSHILESSGYFTNEKTLSIIRTVKLVTSGFGLIKSGWIYMALIFLISLGMYLLFKR